MTFEVYIIHSKSLDRFYVGYASNLEYRLSLHNSGKSTYTSAGKPWILIWSVPKPREEDATLLKKKIKNIARNKKVEFILRYRFRIRIRNLDFLLKWS